MDIEFRLLGDVEVWGDNRLIPIRGARQRGILVALLIDVNHSVPRDVLLDRVWGTGRLPARPANAVQTQMTLLRRALSPATDVRITWQSTGYRITADEQAIDMHRFRELVRRAHAAEDAAAVALFEQAVESWHGEPFACLDTPWFTLQRATLAREQYAAQLDLTDVRLRCGQHAALLAGLTGQAVEHPLDERIAGQVMLALYRSGRAADALRHYHQLRQRLVEEVGTDPSRALRELYQQILATDPRLTCAVTSPGELSPHTVMRGVPPRNPFFTGRDDVLRRIHEHLQGAATAAVHMMPLHGMGGVGKTQLAIEYAHRYAADYRLMWWVNAEDATLAIASLSALAAELGLSTDRLSDTALSGLWRALAARDDWLLVYDNVEDPGVASGLRPPDSGRVLVTGRSPAIGRLNTVVVEVAAFERAESIRLLIQRCPSLTDAQADKIAAALDDLPLAVEQTGCFLADSGLDVTGYLDLLATRPALAGLADPTLERHPGLVSVIAAGRARLREVCPAAAVVLDQLSFLAPEPLALSTRQESYGGVRIGDVAATAGIVRQLANLALVRHTGTTISVHRLVQALLLAHVRAQGRQAEVSMAAQHMLATAHPGDPYDSSTWPAYTALTPHMQALTRHADDGPLVEEPDEFRSLLLDVMRYLLASGQFAEQVSMARRTLARWTRRLGADHPDSLRAATNLAVALLESGDFTAARVVNQDTLDRYRQALGPDHHEALRSAGNLAATLLSLGDYVAARDLGQDTLDRSRRTRGPDHPDTLFTANNLSVALKLTGDHAAARDIGKDVMERYRRTLGPDHTHAMRAANNYGVMLAESGEYVAARDIGRDTLDRYRRVLGADHPDTLVCADSLVVALRELGECAAARDLGLDTLARCRLVLGPDHPDSLVSATSLVLVLANLGEHTAAQDLCEDTLRRYRRVLGDEHPDTLRCVQILAEWCRD